VIVNSLIFGVKQGVRRGCKPKVDLGESHEKFVPLILHSALIHLEDKTAPQNYLFKGTGYYFFSM